MAYMTMAYIAMAYIAMACIAMACIAMAYIAMVCIAMACKVMACNVMACIAMAYIVMAFGRVSHRFESVRITVPPVVPLTQHLPVIHGLFCRRSTWKAITIRANYIVWYICM